MKKIATLGRMHDDGLKLLKYYKYSIVNISDYSNNNLKDKLKDVDAIALRTVKLTKDILKECPGCNYGSFPVITLFTRSFSALTEKLSVIRKTESTLR